MPRRRACILRAVDISRVVALSHGRLLLKKRRQESNNGVTALRYAVAHGNADVAEFLRAHGAAEVDGGRLSMSPAAGEEVPETFTNPSPRSAGEASGSASGASL